MKDETILWILGGAALAYYLYKKSQAASIPATQGPTTIAPVAPAPNPSTVSPGV